ncbi:unnamed protein product, partial [Polarella glacialis]
ATMAGLSFGEASVGQRAIGNKVVDRPYQMPTGWAATADLLATTYTDASGKGASTVALVVMQ